MTAAKAGKMRYNGGGAVYGDLAYSYDLDREVRERALRHAGEERSSRESAPKPQVRSISKVQTRQRQQISLLAVIGFLVIVSLALLTLMSYVKLTVLSSSVVELKDQISELKTENITLTTQYEQTYDLAAVKEAAEAAGMTKPSNSQIYYIDLSDGDNAVVYQQKDPGVLSRLLTSLNHGIYAVVEYFD